MVAESSEDGPQAAARSISPSGGWAARAAAARGAKRDEQNHVPPEGFAKKGTAGATSGATGGDGEGSGAAVVGWTQTTTGSLMMMYSTR